MHPPSPPEGHHPFQRRCRIGFLVLALAIVAGGCAIFSGAHVRFLKQPEDANVQLGGNAAFLVEVTPPGATFQWYKNGLVITNATNNLLVIASVTTADVGFYSCTASASPSVSSKSAALSVYGATSTSGGITTVPVTVPYSGSGTSVSGPCGSYLGYVRFPKPGSSPVSYGWNPTTDATSVRLSDLTTGITGYGSTACVVQNSPFRRNCTNSVRVVTVPVLRSTTYQFSTYVNAPAAIPNGTPVSASVDWIR